MKIFYLREAFFYGQSYFLSERYRAYLSYSAPWIFFPENRTFWWGICQPYEQIRIRHPAASSSVSGYRQDRYLRSMGFQNGDLLFSDHLSQYHNFRTPVPPPPSIRYPGRVYPGILPQQCRNPWHRCYPESLRKRRHGTADDHCKCTSL